MKKWTAAVLVLVALAAVGAYIYLLGAASEAYAAFQEPVTLDYAPGMSGAELAAELQVRGVVRSALVFQAYRLLHRDRVLQAGEYEFSEPASVREVFDKLAEGRVKLYSITVPEGLTRFETAERVGRSRFGTAEEFLKLTADPTPIRDLFPTAETLEGCLFPDTYLLTRDAGPKELLAAMLARFREAFRPEGTATPLAPYDALVMASLIEKETAVEDERSLVSSVYHNRLRIGMLMQCDPTVIYGLLLEDRYKGKLYLKDLQHDSPYNTYKYAGLPPGPIASPGRSSIAAALNPADTKFLYFVARSEGRPEHVFSKTLTEHNRAVAQYRRTQR